MKYNIIIHFIALLSFFFVSKNAWTQGCCSGGGGSPIAGGASTGVLGKNQVEIGLSYQFSYSDEFYSGDRDTLNLIDGLSSHYLFFRTDYGISDRLTFSAAFGYYLDRTLMDLGYKDTISSKGIGDLILLPRYSVLNTTKENHRTEFTLGIGVKIPLGSNLDSNHVGTFPSIGEVYAISPPTVQTTTGAVDVMFNSFVYRGYPKRKLNFFSNALYIKKGYNSLGQKFGDFFSLGLFASKTLFKRLGITAQIRGEWLGSMKVARTVNASDLVVFGIDLKSSGYKKLIFSPQLSYTYKSITMYATNEIPFYQYLNGVQAGSLYQVTAGLVYRFNVKNNDIKPNDTILLPDLK